MMRSTLGRRPRPSTEWVEQKSDKACFVALPRELFCNIVAYLGPTSSSLCALSQVTREHNAIMTSIGDVMLGRAKLRFRTPLPPRSMNESSTSLFVRHARASKVVHDNLEVLNQVLKKDFPLIKTSPSLEDVTKLPVEYVSIDESLPPAENIIVDPSEVHHALNVALCLLGCPEQHFFEDANEAHVIAENASTSALEWRISSLCSKLGARAYKYAKSRMCRRYEREDALFSSYAVTDQMPLEEESDYDEDDEDISLDPSEIEMDQDMSILDKASLVMQHVVLREQERVRQTGVTSVAPARAAAAMRYVSKNPGQVNPQYYAHV